MLAYLYGWKNGSDKRGIIFIGNQGKETKVSVVFGYIGKDSVYLASGNRITDTEGNFVSDDDIKIEVVNNKTAVAFAGNYAAQNFFLKML